MADETKLGGICVITARGTHGLDDHMEIAKAAVEAGASMVQLREKSASTRELYELASRIRAITSGTETKFIVNDRVDIALAVDADGAHVGPDDLPWHEARRLLGSNRILGVSAATLAELKVAEAAGADYLGVGPAYVTGSKADAGDAIGPKGIASIVSLTRLPIIAIGGITVDNAAPIWKAGASGVAVISAVSNAKDRVAAIRALMAISNE